jgi:rhamnopyranosyl-N-acetylglucosaminyl-diphospho-decaprenol beta-1,3/1,4-galactofuranosyltransferase
MIPVISKMAGVNESGLIIGVVIVTYNRINDLKISITKTLLQPIDIILVINNCSTDDTHVWLDSLDDHRVVVLHLPCNIGGAGGFYTGFKYITENTNCDWLCCYDDDAYPTADTFYKFREKNWSDIDGIAGAVYTPSGEINTMNTPIYSPFREVKTFVKSIIKMKTMIFMPPASYHSDKVIPIHGSSFVGLFVRVSSIRDKYGYPRAELFIYSDDAIYTCAMTRDGGRIVFCPEIKFVHAESSTCTTEGVSLWRKYYQYRNGLEWLHLESSLVFWLFVPIKFVFWSAKMFKTKHGIKCTFMAVRDAILRKFNLYQM